MVKGLLYAYRSALTGIHLLRTGECIGDVTELAALYGFDQVAGLAARKRSGSEKGEMDSTDGFEADLGRLESQLQEAYDGSALPEQATNTEAIDTLLVRVRRQRFT